MRHEALWSTARLLGYPAPQPAATLIAGPFGACTYNIARSIAGLGAALFIAAAVWFGLAAVFQATWAVQVWNLSKGSAVAAATAERLAAVNEQFNSTISSLDQTLQANLGPDMYQKVSAAAQYSDGALRAFQPGSVPSGAAPQDGIVATQDMVCPSRKTLHDIRHPAATLIKFSLYYFCIDTLAVNCRGMPESAAVSLFGKQLLHVRADQPAHPEWPSPGRKAGSKLGGSGNCDPASGMLCGLPGSGLQLYCSPGGPDRPAAPAAQEVSTLPRGNCQRLLEWQWEWGKVKAPHSLVCVCSMRANLTYSASGYPDSSPKLMTKGQAHGIHAISAHVTPVKKAYSQATPQ